MNFFGVGPRIFLASLPSIIITAAAGYIWPRAFRMATPPALARAVGAILAALFVAAYVPTARQLLKGIKTGTLQTRGVFALCRNPLYACFVYLFVPALAFLLRNWLILLVSLNLYAAFKWSIHEEYAALDKAFGEEHARYRRRVNELLPLPRPQSRAGRCAVAACAWAAVAALFAALRVFH